MAEAGILREYDRVELIRGEIVEMSPTGRRHKAFVANLAQLLIERLGGRALVFVQSGVVLADDTEPEPDVTVLRRREVPYKEREAHAEDVLLLIEVADTSIRYDRSVKLPLYARAGVPEVWIVDLPADAIEVYRQPTPTGYTESTRAGRGGAVTPAAFPGVTLSVDQILVLPAR
jgi:hypothetical protein